MPITMLDAVDFTKVPALAFVVPVVAADPAGYEAGLIYNSTEKALKFHNGTTWVAVGAAGAGGPPSGAAGGDLAGSYPNPTIAANIIVDADVNSAANIAQSKIANLTTDLGAKALKTTALTAGAGLTGGGDLSAARTFDIGQGTGIVVSADSVSVDATYLGNNYLPKSGGTMTGAIVLPGNPAAANEAANKAYVDLLSQGFSFKNACRAVSTTNIASFPPTAPTTIDGVALALGDRVLIAGQTTASQNGIYIVNNGAAWFRDADADASGEIKDGTLVPIAEGTANADSLYICTSVGTAPWVPGTNSSVWTKFSSSADLAAGAGLTKTGTTIDFVAGDGTLTVAADNVKVASAPKWTTTRTIAVSGDASSSAANIDGTGNVNLAVTATTCYGGAYNIARRQYMDVPAGTACVIPHGFGTQDCVVEVFSKSAPYDRVLCDVEHTDINNITLRFATAVAANAYRCVIIG